MTEEIKPCPFCKSTKIHVHEDKNSISVICPICGMSGPTSIVDSCNDEISEAVHWWNLLPRYPDNMIPTNCG